MTARRITIHTQRAYDFYFVGGQTQYVELIRYVDATAFVSGQLVVRLHEKGASWPDGSALVVEAHNVSPAPDEPATLFVDSGRVVASVTIAKTDAAPDVFISSFDGTGAIGPYLRLRMRTSLSEGVGQVDCTLGIELIGRDA